MWPDSRIREELTRRLATGGEDLCPSIRKLSDINTLLMRGHIPGTLRHGGLLLAGDAAHIITQFGAKGANLDVADVTDLTCRCRAAGCRPAVVGDQRAEGLSRRRRGRRGRRPGRG
ncbi:FAD-dependent monooxygenase [Streptomyces sp. NPDC001034]|uniref:FAD-dependent monooxygenase n=1 Tax=Streptomyces sp. NPDC001034 TaxID=3154375 RepID=UPI00332FEDA3